ncbi:DUF2971 domain-containing protein [Comamonas testosteroni]|uniref:DUF2971 domain-containing protein n=1 Tax=Comamonas testosteroni TaxID=285 RepID=A0A373FN50_COMTE|nr:DUF2971 domain-containing protein [Comamonas testosteroni]
MAPSAVGPLGDLSRAMEELLGFVDKSGVFSLSGNPLQELIWAHYGGSHCGFCIGYQTKRLVAFEPNTHIVLKVQYSNEAPSIALTDLLRADSNSVAGLVQKILGVKSKPWAYEEEIRVITQPPGLHAHDYRAVKEVYFGLNCPESTKQAVMEALAGRNVTYHQVISPQSSYALKSTTIPDRYASAPRYMTNCAPIEDGAILLACLKPEQKQYTEYLNRAAEIVRRDPYCKAVQSVAFSSSNVSAAEPIIIVQCQTALGKFVNLFMTIQEIDEKYSVLDHQNA